MKLPENYSFYFYKLSLMYSLVQVPGNFISLLYGFLSYRQSCPVVNITDSGTFLPGVFLKKILFIYFQREGKGGRKRGRETSMCSCLSHAPYWGPGLQPRHVPWLGIEPATLWFTGRSSIHWATPTRAYLVSWMVETSLLREESLSLKIHRVWK